MVAGVCTFVCCRLCLLLLFDGFRFVMHGACGSGGVGWVCSFGLDRGGLALLVLVLVVGLRLLAYLVLI